MSFEKHYTATTTTTTTTTTTNYLETIQKKSIMSGELTIPLDVDRFKGHANDDKPRYRCEAKQKREQTFSLNFTDLKASFEYENEFSEFLVGIYVLLKEKKIPYVSLKGFENLSESDKATFTKFVKENPYLFDCPPPTNERERDTKLARWPIIIECEIKPLIPLLARNTFLAVFLKNENLTESSDDLWQKIVDFMLNQKVAEWTPEGLVFKHTVEKMWDQLFEHMLVYCKDNKPHDNTLNCSPLHTYLTYEQLDVLIAHIGNLRFNNIILTVVVDKDCNIYEKIFRLLLTTPFICETLKINVKNHKNEDREDFYTKIESLYGAKDRVTTALYISFTNNHISREITHYDRNFAELALANRREAIRKNPKLMELAWVPPPDKPTATLWSNSPYNKYRTGKRGKFSAVQLQRTLQHTAQREVYFQTQYQVKKQVTTLLPSTQAHSLFDRKSFLKQFPSNERTDMASMWDSVCGTIPSSIYIQWLTPPANQQLCRYPYIYQGGLVKNTPNFYIEQQNGERVLNFVTGRTKPKSPFFTLTPIPYPTHKLLENYGTAAPFSAVNKSDDLKYNSGSLGVFKQMLKDKESLLIHYKDLFRPYIDKTNGSSKNTEPAVNPAWLKFCARSGENQVEILVKSLNDLYLRSPDTFNQFYDNFLDRSRDFSEFATKENLAVIKNITRFSDNQLLWWHTLVANHHKHLPFHKTHEISLTNLVDLYNGFNCFLENYEALARKNSVPPDLPSVCRFKNAINLKTSLYRLFNILNNAKNFREQINYLEDLDLGPEGAEYASSEEGFCFVASSMQLTPMSLPTLYFSQFDISPNVSPKRFNSQLPIVIESNTDLNGKNGKFGSFFFLFDGKDLYPIASGRDIQQHIYECLDPHRNYFETIPRDISYFISERVPGLFRPLTSSADSYLSYTVDYDLLRRKLLYNSFLFKSNDNSLDFVQLFYRALGKLDDLPPFGEVMNLVNVVENALKNQQQNQKKFLLLFFKSLNGTRLQRTIPIPLIQEFFNTHNNLSQEELSTLLDKSLNLIQQHNFTLTATVELLKGLKSDSNDLLPDLINSMGNLFGKSLDTLGKQPNKIELNVYLECLKLLKISKFEKTNKVLPLLSIVDKTGFSVDEFEKFNQQFLKLTVKQQEELTYIWSILDIEASTGNGKKLPTLNDWFNLIVFLSSFYKINDYTQIESVVLNKFPNLKINILEKMSKITSIETFLTHIELTDDLREKLKNHAEDDYENLLRASFNAMDKKQQETVFSIEVVLNILSHKAIKDKNIDELLEKELIALLTKKLALALPNKIDSVDALDKLFAYTRRYASFLTTCQKFNPELFTNIILPLLCAAKTPLYIKSLTTILDVISNNDEYKKVFPTDLLATLLGHQDAEIFLPLHPCRKKATLYITKVLSHDYSSNSKKLLINNFFCSIKKIDNKNQGLFFIHLEKILNLTSIVEKSMLDLWHHLNTDDDANIVDLFNVILPLLEKCPENFQENLLVYLQQHTTSTITDIINTIESKSSDENKEYILIILASFHCEKNQHSPELLKTFVNYLVSHETSAKVLSAACVKRPSPPFSQLCTLFSSNPAKQVNNFVTKFHTEPHGKRNLEAQFNTDQVLRIINNLVDLKTGRPLPYEERQKLVEYFSYINAIGNTQPVWNGRSVRNLSPTEIGEVWREIREIIQNRNTSSKKKWIAHLVAIAISREVLYRSSKPENPIFPDSTQIIDLILTLHPGNSALEIATGQGKSVVETIKASLFSLYANGKDRVFSLTPRFPIAARNLDTSGPYFEYLNIPYSKKVITENSSIEDLVPGGIHHTTPIGFGMFMDKQLLSLRKELGIFMMIVSEFDHSANNLTHISHSVVTNTRLDDPKTSNIAWIYRLVNNFCTQTRNQNYESIEDEIVALKIYIEKNATTKQLNILEVEKISSSQLDRWLDAAKTLPTLKQNIDYILTTKIERSATGEKTVGVIQILENGEPSNSEYGRSLQQLLCDKLNQEVETNRIDSSNTQSPTYKITPEGERITLLTHKNLMMLADQLFVTTATLGSKQEIKQIGTEFNFKTILKVPRHQPDKRIRLTFLDQNTEARKKHVLADITKILAEGDTLFSFWKDPIPPMPILLTPKNIEEANEWFDAIKAKFAGHPRIKILQLYTGKNSERYDCKNQATSSLQETGNQTIDEQITLQTGVAGTITVSTLMSRETDIKPRYALNLESSSHPLGLCSIQVYLATYRDEEQTAGRPGRRGMAGRSYLYVAETELEEEVKQQKSQLSAKKRIKHAQATLEKKATLKLKQHNIAGDYLRELYEYFLSLYHLVDPANQKRNQLYIQWIAALEQLDDAWFDIMAENNVADESEQEEKLSHCIDQYIKLLKEECKGLISIYTMITNNNQMIPEEPTFAREEEANPTTHLPPAELISPPPLLLPNGNEIAQICHGFNKIVALPKEMDMDIESNLGDTVSEKLHSINKALSAQIGSDLDFNNNIQHDVKHILSGLLFKYDTYFKSPKLTSGFTALLPLHHQLIELVDKWGDENLKEIISSAMSNHYLTSLKNNYPTGSETPFFTYYTHLKHWQSTNKICSFSSYLGSQPIFANNVISNMIKNLGQYENIYCRSNDRVKNYLKLKQSLSRELDLKELDLKEFLSILIKAREEALQTDLKKNKKRKLYFFSLPQRDIDSSRYQKLLDSEIAKVTLALEVLETPEKIKEIQEKHMKQLLGHLSSDEYESFKDFLKAPDKFLKKLNKTPLEKDEKAIVDLLTEKSQFFTHVTKSTQTQEDITLVHDDKGKEHDLIYGNYSACDKN